MHRGYRRRHPQVELAAFAADRRCEPRLLRCGALLGSTATCCSAGRPCQGTDKALPSRARGPTHSFRCFPTWSSARTERPPCAALWWPRSKFSVGGEASLNVCSLRGHKLFRPGLKEAPVPSNVLGGGSKSLECGHRGKTIGRGRFLPIPQTPANLLNHGMKVHSQRNQ